MIVFPHGKINIGLRIVSKRPDSFHNIETVFYPVGISDALEFVVSGDQGSGADKLQVTGYNVGKTDDNIIMKIITRLHRLSKFPYLALHLHKAIPAGAGLGGGSSDAAFLLKAVNKHYELGLDDRALKAIALETGSDCPFFLESIPSLASGKGEILTSLPDFLSGKYLVLLNPGISVNTAEAYANCVPHETEKNPGSLVNLPVESWKDQVLNDFEEYVFRKHTLIADLKKDLYNKGALFSLMSGSGSSVYGIFKEKPLLPPALSNYLIWEGAL